MDASSTDFITGIMHLLQVLTRKIRTKSRLKCTESIWFGPHVITRFGIGPWQPNNFKIKDQICIS